MKSLKNYIMEAVNSKADVKEAEPIKPVSVKFNFKDLENGEDKKKELVELLNAAGLSFEDDDLSVSLTVNGNDSDKFKDVMAFINDYAKELRNSSKRTNDESYAQKTKSFDDAANKLLKVLDGNKEHKEEQSNNDEE